MCCRGLEAIGESSYAVVVSDVSGIEFLARVKEIAPDTVRILRTGQADLEVAIAAVNYGNVFRFLSKPCPQDLPCRTPDAALEQYRMCVVRPATHFPDNLYRTTAELTWPERIQQGISVQCRGARQPR